MTPAQKKSISEAARIMGSIGGRKGGLTSAKNMTKDERIARARKASLAYWESKRKKP
jgi:hypothetical protein